MPPPQAVVVFGRSVLSLQDKPHGHRGPRVSVEGTRGCSVDAHEGMLGSKMLPEEASCLALASKTLLLLSRTSIPIASFGCSGNASRADRQLLEPLGTVHTFSLSVSSSDASSAGTAVPHRTTGRRKTASFKLGQMHFFHPGFPAQQVLLPFKK